VTGSSSISGLASGLDTATIISQLMQLEAIPQDRLKTQQAAERAVVTALRQLNTDTSLLTGKAQALAKATTWQTLKATSTSSDVTATAAADAAATSFTVTVGTLASGARTSYATELGADDNALTVAGDPVVLTLGDGSTRPITTGTGTLKDLVAGINAEKAGVTATMVKSGTGYRLLLTADATGEAATEIGLSNVNLGAVDAIKGQDATLTIGGIEARSTTNTFTDLVPGVTVTLGSTAKENSTATIKVAQDSSSVKSAVGDLVDQVNKLLTTIDSQTATKTSTTAAGVLAGDATARSLRNALVETVFGGSGSMASLGIQTDRYGKLVFDAAKFADAYAADPAGVAAKFTSAGPTPSSADGWAARLATVTKTASDSTTGTITTAIAGRNTTIDRLSDSIAQWDDRLELRRTTLERQYTALETALSSLQSQGTWLAGQIAGLPKYSS
jgi:flagellar hook-associated protein 2